MWTHEVYGIPFNNLNPNPNPRGKIRPIITSKYKQTQNTPHTTVLHAVSTSSLS